MAVSLTTPAIEIRGEAAIFSEKVAVRVTTPEVIILSESLVVIVAVATELHVPQFGNLFYCNADPVAKAEGSELKFTVHQPEMS